MKKKYINPETKTIELLSTIMMLTVSSNDGLEGTKYGSAVSNKDADAQGRRNGWDDPWN